MAGVAALAAFTAFFSLFCHVMGSNNLVNMAYKRVLSAASEGTVYGIEVCFLALLEFFLCSSVAFGSTAN